MFGYLETGWDPVSAVSLSFSYVHFLKPVHVALTYVLDDCLVAFVS